MSVYSIPLIETSKNKKQNDGVRDPSPIKKSTSASPITTQASTAAASISASTPSQSSTVVVAKGTRGSAFGARTVPTGTSGASGGAESHSSESPHGAPRSSRATRKSRTPRNSDTRSSPSGNLFDALSHDDASVSSASSQDQHEPMFSVGSCVFPAESIYYNSVFQRR